MVLSEAIRDYCEYARHELGHSPNTWRTYAASQRHFARWLADQGFQDPPVEQVTSALIRRYSYSLSARNLRPRTICGALHALRALYRFLTEMRLVANDPVAEVRLPKKDAATRLLVTDDELMQLLAATGRQRGEFRCIRDAAVVSVLVFCGLRRQELLDLTVQDVLLQDGSLLVQQGKGSKSRTIYLCDEVAAALREWLALRGKRNCRHEFLFLGEDGRRLGDNGLHALLEDAKAIAGFKGDPRIKPHSIRHAAATRLLRNGADIRSIQAWLGHSQLQTTAIYLHTNEQQVRKIAPLASLQPPAPMPPTAPAPVEPARAEHYRRQRTGR